MSNQKSRRCLVHIGQPKTGSTSIQSHLGQQREELLGHGIYFWQGFQPTMLEVAQRTRPSLVGMSPGQNFLLVPPYRSEPPPLLVAAGVSQIEFQNIGTYFWKKFKSEVEETQADTVVVSCELIFHPQFLPHFIRRLKGFFEFVEVIAYLRNPVDHYPSGISELTRILTPVDRLVPSSWEGGNLLETLDSLESTPELDGLHLKLFAPGSLFGQDVVKDFLATLADLTGKPLGASTDSKSLNRALPGSYYAWLFFHSGYYTPSGQATIDGDFVKHLLMAREVARQLNGEGLVPLSIRDTPLDSLIRRRRGGEWNQICDRYLNGIGKLEDPTGECRKVAQDDYGQERAQFVQWLRSYLDQAWTEYFDELHRKIFIDD